MECGLVGSPPASQRESYNAGEDEDSLIGSTDLIDFVEPHLFSSLVHVNRRELSWVDAGPLHIAAAVGTPTLGTSGMIMNVEASPTRLWMPRCQISCKPPVTCSNVLTIDFGMMSVWWRIILVACIRPSEVINWLALQLV